MFSWLRKDNWRSSPAHLLLLSKFRLYASPREFCDKEYWELALKQKPSEAIDIFMKEGVLERAGLNEAMAFKYKLPDLKSLLKERGLKLSGLKEELIRRLIENDTKTMVEATKDIYLCRCTASGIALVGNYLESEERKKSTAEQEVLRLLQLKEYGKAVRSVAEYEATQVFPRGLGIDWEKYDGISDIRCLQTIFNSTPSILQTIATDKLDHLRLGAAMMHLWGTNKAQPWLAKEFSTGIRLGVDTACRMLTFHAYHIRELRDFRESGVRSVEILGSYDSCSECRKVIRKKYRLENVPELPHPKCTREYGCRCTMVIGSFR